LCRECAGAVDDREKKSSVIMGVERGEAIDDRINLLALLECLALFFSCGLYVHFFVVFLFSLEIY
jgi:hypothetical protein